MILNLLVLFLLIMHLLLQGLKANVSRMPLEEGPMLRQEPLKLDLLNEDSSSRKRSSSLTEQV